ncbi:hypothetical protein ACJX0J_040057, partial [Zea mays]
YVISYFIISYLIILIYALTLPVFLHRMKTKILMPTIEGFVKQKVVHFIRRFYIWIHILEMRVFVGRYPFTDCGRSYQSDIFWDPSCPLVYFIPLKTQYVHPMGAPNGCVRCLVTGHNIASDGGGGGGYYVMDLFLSPVVIGFLIVFYNLVTCIDLLILFGSLCP